MNTFFIAMVMWINGSGFPEFSEALATVDTREHCMAYVVKRLDATPAAVAAGKENGLRPVALCVQVPMQTPTPPAPVKKPKTDVTVL